MVPEEVRPMHKLARTIFAGGALAALLLGQSTAMPGTAVALQDTAAGGAPTQSINRYLVHVNGMT
jgi:uncharacterized membrane protein YebE (DUF533 family)